mmetsp:Transcript_4418/g.13405  ORF Transcript_4418/g.13405 Transcript_4418/m.13405 type:complete len:297 (+) Transcript_4418:2204-3094(+)
MSATEEDFWGHKVLGTTERVGTAHSTRLKKLGQPKVCKPHVPILIDEDIFRLQVTIHCSQVVNEVDGQDNFTEKMFDHVLLQVELMRLQVIVQVTAGTKLRHHVQVSFGLEGVLQLHNEGVSCRHFQHESLVEGSSHGLSAVFYAVPLQDFHGEAFSSLLVPDQEHSAHAALSNRVKYLKVGQSDLFTRCCQPLEPAGCQRGVRKRQTVCLLSVHVSDLEFLSFSPPLNYCIVHVEHNPITEHHRSAPEFHHDIRRRLSQPLPNGQLHLGARIHRSLPYQPGRLANKLAHTRRAQR